jgi:hypothetical protein
LFWIEIAGKTEASEINTPPTSNLRMGGERI